MKDTVIKEIVQRIPLLVNMIYGDIESWHIDVLFGTERLVESMQYVAKEIQKIHDEILEKIN